MIKLCWNYIFRLCKISHLLLKIGSDELYNRAGICAKCMVESI